MAERQHPGILKDKIVIVVEGIDIVYLFLTKNGEEVME